MDNSMVDVAIIGAGPYGLSIASYLRANGVGFRIFGSPMRFWVDMPQGISLKSPDTATNIYTPLPNYRFTDYCKARNIRLAINEPIDMRIFAEYGLWAQRELVPEVEDVQISRLERGEVGFALTLSTGEQVTALRVVVAVGVGYLKYVPESIAHLTPQVMTHSYQHSHWASLTGKDVTVLGRGQSALEAARALIDHGAHVRMLVRADNVVFHGKLPERRSLLKRIIKPNSVVGPSRIGKALEVARTLTHYLPEQKRVEMTDKMFPAFGTWWLKEHLEGRVEVLLRTHLVHAQERDGEVRLTLRDDSGERELVTDHLVACTGYRYDVNRLPFLSAQLSVEIDRIKSAPRLTGNFESSVAGLYFVGPLAAYSFGPLQRFVCGAEFAAPTVASHLAKTRQSLSRVPVIKSSGTARSDARLNDEDKLNDKEAAA